jgi:endonuclease-3
VQSSSPLGPAGSARGGSRSAEEARAFKAPSPRRVARIRDRLRAVYGVPLIRPHGHPIAELVLTVLSQSTNDRNRDLAYLRLRERMPSWQAVMRAPVREVEEAIRPGGISRVKSARIQAILSAIAAEEPDPPHGVSLDWLGRVPVGEGRDYLLTLPGVGRKTAACVLLFAFGLREVPVDTHVSRVAIRLGLLPAGAPFAELHDRMLALTPPGQELELHVNLLRHGRRTCHARSPACGQCALSRMCPSRKIFMSSGNHPGAPARRGSPAARVAQPRGSTANAITA